MPDLTLFALLLSWEMWGWGGLGAFVGLWGNFCPTFTLLTNAWAFMKIFFQSAGIKSKEGPCERLPE